MTSSTASSEGIGLSSGSTGFSTECEPFRADELSLVSATAALEESTVIGAGEVSSVTRSFSAI